MVCSCLIRLPWRGERCVLFALRQSIEDNLGELTPINNQGNTMSEHTIQGIAASEGIAIGPAFIYHPPDLTIPRRNAEAPDREFARFRDACRQASQELDEIREMILPRAGEEHAAIFDAHKMMLDDPMLEGAVQQRINAGQIAEQALSEATQEIADMLAAMEDEMFAARAADVQDVGRRVLRILLGVPDTSLDTLREPSIVVAHDLTPSDTARLDPDMALGLCTAAGGLTSHTAILARTLGIPAVVGLGAGLLDQVQDGAQLVLDGIEGVVIVDPGDATRKQFETAGQRRAVWLEEIQARAHEDAYTADGKRVEVAANIGDVESAREAVTYGAEGVGLLRTEFLYLNDVRPPAEEKQVKAYRDIFEALAGKPVIVRTLDIGGDKPPSYLEFEEELNPFLGWRAIRICLDDLPLFKTQLRAILRAADGHNVLIMYPMISGLDELRRANAVLDEVRAELDAEGMPYAKDVPAGIMVETPAAVALADILADECDFFSLGTNDLTQYTLAVDRTNGRVAGLFQPLHPAVLRLIRQTIDAAHSKGKWVGMCGELAGMQKAIPILIGLGLDEFSMVSRAIPEAKWLIGRLTGEEASRIADQALSLGTAAEVEAFMQETLSALEE